MMQASPFGAGLWDLCDRVAEQRTYHRGSWRECEPSGMRLVAARGHFPRLERVFNDAKTAQSRGTEMTVMWNRWRSTLFTWYLNAIAIGPAGSWPLWSARTIVFYGLSIVLWLGFFLVFIRLRRSSAALRDKSPDPA